MSERTNKALTRYIYTLVLAVILAMTAGCSMYDHGAVRQVREMIRDTGSEAGKVLAAIPVAGTLKADVLVYSALIEPRVTCLRLEDYDRVAKEIALGDSLAVSGAGEPNGDQCTRVGQWWRTERAKNADSVVALRHDIAVRLFGVSYPESFNRFVGLGPTYLHRAELQQLADHAPDLIRALSLWGVNIDILSTLSSRVEEICPEEPAATSALPAADARCLGAMYGVASHLPALDRAITHAEQSHGMFGAHPGLEDAAEGIALIVAPYVRVD